MFILQLNTLAAAELTMSEKLSIGFQTLLLGMGMVMLVLVFLWGILELFKKVFYKEGNNKTEHVTTPDEPADFANANETDKTDDKEIIAAITAAITAYRASEMAAEQITGGFRVISFKKAGKSAGKN